MEKRFFLALLLTAIVIILTPVIFPTPKPPARAPGLADTLGTGADTLPGRGPAATPVDSPTVPRQPDPATAAAVPAPRISGDTTVITMPLANYTFSSAGGTLVSTTVRPYRSLEGDGGPVVLTAGAEPLLRYRLITPSDTIQLDEVEFQREASRDSLLLGYSATVNGRQIRVSYAVQPDSYTVRVVGRVEGLAAPAYLLVDLPSTLRSAEADTLDDQRQLAYAYKQHVRDANSIPFGKLDPGERRVVEGPLTWAAAKNKYFVVALLTDARTPPFLELVAVGRERPPGAKTNTLARATVVQQLVDGAFGFELYTGPQEWQRLHAVGREFENVNPYGGFVQRVVQPFAVIVVRILLWMKATLQISYGWILVIFGVLVRLLLWPLNQRAMRTSLQMQRLQPALADIQKRYGRSEPEKYRAEVMRVYKEHNMSPFSPLMGCLPMMLPMPVLIALFFVFQNTIEFRGVPFMWLPDISLKDPLYILPVLMGLSMFLVSWISLRASPPNPQAKMMAYVFPVVLTVIFLNFPSGLNLYYFVQNLASLPQQWLIAREKVRSGAAVRKPATASRERSASQ